MDVRHNIYRTFDVNGIPLDAENQNPTATPGAPAVDVQPHSRGIDPPKP